MAIAPVARNALRVAAVTGLIVTLLVVLHLITSAVQNSAALSRIFVPLLVISLIGLASLLVLVVVSLVRLIRAYRKGEPGSRLTARMVILFVILSLFPVGVVYGYSLQFLLRGIDSWFDVEIDQAMRESLSLGQASLDLHKRNLLHITEGLVGELQEVPREMLALKLGELRRTAGATELAIMDGTGRTLASSNKQPGVLVAFPPDTSVLQQVREGRNYVGVTPYGEDTLLHVRAVVADLADTTMILQALYPLTQRVSDLSDQVQAAFTRYRELSFLRQSLKFSFSLSLLLVLLFSFFTAVWAAIVSARRLLAPLSHLAVATRAVADGDYSTQLPPPRTGDELGFLVSSFNSMTRRIAMARDAATESQRHIEAQRSYLESVLSHLSSGVMTFSGDSMLRTANQAAHQILGLNLDDLIGRPLHHLAEEKSELSPLVDSMAESMHAAGREWQSEVTLIGGDGRTILRCGGSRLPMGEDGGLGWLIMIEDITALIQAQRDSAWGEVARRLAHEIKNPLTPIQLSAERMRRRYLGKLAPDDAEVLDRATHTIVQQVEAMKSMVNAFSDYARPSRPESQSVVFDALVSEVLELYRATGGVSLRIELGAADARVKADAVKLRQVIHNLIKNAQEAVSEVEAGGLIRVATWCIDQDDNQIVELVVEDNGPGFDRELMGRVFEPYVTTKAKGTGLGLAIVRKIVEEHGGSIAVGQSDLGGGRVTVRLPECKPTDVKTLASSTR